MSFFNEGQSWKARLAIQKILDKEGNGIYRKNMRIIWREFRMGVVFEIFLIVLIHDVFYLVFI